MTSGRVLRAGRCGIRGHGKAHFLAEGAGYVRCPNPAGRGAGRGLGPGCRGDGQPVAVSPGDGGAGRGGEGTPARPAWVPVTTDPSAPLRRPVSWTRPPRPSSPSSPGDNRSSSSATAVPSRSSLTSTRTKRLRWPSRQAPERGSIRAVSRRAVVPWFMSGSSGWRHHDEDARVTGREGGR
jgi:hypothetical protein